VLKNKSTLLDPCLLAGQELEWDQSLVVGNVDRHGVLEPG
jgi:hypothetical protein